jgi:hypothetical protein
MANDQTSPEQKNPAPDQFVPPLGTVPPLSTVPPLDIVPPLGTVPPLDTVPPLGTVKPLDVVPPLGTVPPLSTVPPLDTALPNPQAAPTNPPIAINGAAVVPATQSSTAAGAGDKQIQTETLYSAGDVSITRETVTTGDHPFSQNQAFAPFPNPNAAANQFDRTVVINTGSGDDNVSVSQRTVGSSNVLDVDVNGQKFEITLAPGQELAVRTADGNDRVIAAGNVTVAMDVRGGDGNDTITTGQGNDRVDGGLGDDTITTNAGRDDVFGNSGNDTIDAGDGHDQVHGGDGNDQLQGGRGRDYVDGGQGNDTVQGGSGNDILVGGQGDDTLRSQEGNDRVYTGAGKDTVDNAAGNDVVYGQNAEDTFTSAKGANHAVTNVDMTQTVGSSITVQGSPEFQQRVQSDLDFLRSSPEGRGLLTQLDAAAAANPQNAVTLTELGNEHNGYAWRYNAQTQTFGANNAMFQTTGASGQLALDANGQPIPGSGTGTTVEYNPSSHSDQFPASVGTLFHELSHAYNNVTGTTYPGSQTAAGTDINVPFAEHQVVGLPGTPAAYNFPGGNGASNTNPFTENDLRSEMGLPQRPSYTLPPTWNGGMGSPTAMAPTGTGGTQFASTGDPMLDRMLAAAQSGNTQDLRVASSSLYERDAGQFKELGVSDLSRLQNDQAQTKPQEIKPPQIEQPEQQVVSAGGMRR